MLNYHPDMVEKNQEGRLENNYGKENNDSKPD